MTREEIEVTIGPDGQVSIQVRGVQGKGCLDLTRPLEAALGGVVESRTATAEQYVEPQSTRTEKTR